MHGWKLVHKAKPLTLPIWMIHVFFISALVFSIETLTLVALYVDNIINRYSTVCIDKVVTSLRCLHISQVANRRNRLRALWRSDSLVEAERKDRRALIGINLTVSRYIRPVLIWDLQETPAKVVSFNRRLLRGNVAVVQRSVERAYLNLMSN